MSAFKTIAPAQLFLVSGLITSVFTLSSVARAEDPPVTPAAAPPAPTAPAPATSSPPAADKPPAPPADLQAPTSTKRTETLTPKPVYLPSTLNGSRLQADPIADGAVITISLGFTLLSESILSTGEIRPQQISPTFSTSHLLAIDRAAVNQTVSPSAGLMSNLGLYAAVGYAAVDTIATGFRQDSKQAALIDFIIYAEAGALTAGVTNLAKMAVRRPRPYAYIEAAAHKNDPDYSNADSDSSLSFFSGHTAMVGAMTGAATYLAFTRSPHSIRPWLTLAGGAALTTFVGVERVRAGKHFPTDVIAGGLAGAGIGVLTAHLHREDTAKQRPVWIGYTPTEGQGGMLTLGGLL